MQKQIPTTIGILIILIFAAAVGASALFFSQEIEKEVAPKEETFIDKDEVIEETFIEEDEMIEENGPEEDETVHSNLTKKEKNGSLLDKVKREMGLEIRKKCEGVQVGEVEKNEDPFSFPWLTQSNEVRLIGGYKIILDVPVESRECVQGVVADYLLKNGAIKDKKNSAGEFPIAWGFEKDNIKFSLNLVKLHGEEKRAFLFGDKEEDVNLEGITMEDYSKIFRATWSRGPDKDFNFRPEYRVIAHNRVGDFVSVTYDAFPGSNSGILKKENSEWRYLVSYGQDIPFCEVIFDEKIPPAMVDYCWSLENNCFMEYDEKTDTWECPEPGLGFLQNNYI